jgi:hypothetical protein
VQPFNRSKLPADKAAQIRFSDMFGLQFGLIRIKVKPAANASF